LLAEAHFSERRRGSWEVFLCGSAALREKKYLIKIKSSINFQFINDIRTISFSYYFKNGLNMIS
jgi:hypothetical protein